MELRLLRYFLAVANEQSITKAAKMLHITQPTLSRQIAQLEDEAGAELFVHGSRPLTLTADGILLKRRAEEILELVAKTEEELSGQNEYAEGTVCVGCGELTAVKYLSDMIAGFREKYPKVIFDVVTANADQIKSRMDHGLTDVGLLLEPIDMEKYNYIRLPVKEKWVAVVPSGDPLAKKGYASPKDLAGRPVILPGRQKVKDEIASWFGDYYQKLNVAATSNLSTNAAMMVRSGMGYALVVEGGLPFLDTSEVCMVPLEPELAGTTVLAWKRNQPSSRIVERFMEHVKHFLS